MTEHDIRALLSYAAKVMPLDQRRAFRAFLAKQKPKPSRNARKVHSWRLKFSPSVKRIRIRRRPKQMDMFEP